MTKNVLYVGNYLKGPKTNPSYMFTLGPLLEGLNFKVTYTSSRHLKLLRLLDMMWSLIRRQGQTDVVLIDTYSTLNFYYAVVVGLLCRVYKIKYIPILHGGNLEHRLKNNWVMSKSLFGNAYKLVAPSRFLYDAFKNYKFNNLEYIPNFIEIDKYDFTQREIESIRLLWVRSFSLIYNPKLAIDVLEDLLKYFSLKAFTVPRSLSLSSM